MSCWSELKLINKNLYVNKWKMDQIYDKVNYPHYQRAN